MALDSDWAFTALNVLPHGIPYAVLVWKRSAEAPERTGMTGALLRAGPAVFLTLFLVLAVGEEGSGTSESGMTTPPYPVKAGEIPCK